jgi:hypothetical protein
MGERWMTLGHRPVGVSSPRPSSVCSPSREMETLLSKSPEMSTLRLAATTDRSNPTPSNTSGAPYSGEMLRFVLRWSLRLAVTAVVGAVVARLLADRSGGASGGLLPAITGDTWPPVPTNPAHEG